ncbi:1-acyl-sn-glycerol-3-phosphate acyltransferase [Metabacillus litoralis]|uniref:lysophospholipid acyltransferase family protein n=1 Tax=Metabacillus TaxID=2675233 RepID=UPI001B8F93F9|nr:lysophospholipid acyltransferase family protein [Metabacillus litoralis]MCM3163123.1 1-acyl-sn-glycerol-3-phosphate acyltransferase [Metabacillus litoralis]MCM3410829.1 1-acyl-sn-glycerol-3-phosphate acyltransferase [Metabacillus litoralis]UHA58086.1 1-acyl-sn-glycerol-3-phosphate acyltransferase [Metabacillus litoralis]
MSLYPFARSVVAGLLKPTFRIKVEGLEHFPKEGGVLLCTNHISNIDPPVVGVTAPRKVLFMAKAELFQVPVLKQLLNNFGTFPVKRGGGDREALRAGLKVLKEGNVLGLFPEGTRSKDGKLGKGMSGAGFFALRSTAAVVPCAIIGPYKAFSTLRVVYGKPINMEEYREKKISTEEMTSIIMEEIGKLIQK